MVQDHYESCICMMNIQPEAQLNMNTGNRRETANRLTSTKTNLLIYMIMGQHIIPRKTINSFRIKHTTDNVFLSKCWETDFVSLRQSLAVSQTPDSDPSVSSLKQLPSHFSRGQVKSCHRLCQVKSSHQFKRQALHLSVQIESEQK